MSNHWLITHIASYKLFRQPNKIGDTITGKGDVPLLIIGIEDWYLYNNIIHIAYTCQRLDINTSASRWVYQTSKQLTPFVATSQPDKLAGHHKPGEVFRAADGLFWKVIEYTSITLNGTDIEIGFIARPVYPVSHSAIKPKLEVLRGALSCKQVDNT